MKIVLVIGKPCVGKTEVIQKLLKIHVDEHDGASDWIFNSYKMFKYMFNHRAKTIVAGHYVNESKDPQHMHPDMLPRGVIPNAIDFINSIALKFSDHKIVFEGDRFSFMSFFTFLEKRIDNDFSVKCFCLETSEEQFELRQFGNFGNYHYSSPQFLKALHTRISNLKKDFYFVETLENNTEEQLSDNARKILEY